MLKLLCCLGVLLVEIVGTSSLDGQVSKADSTAIRVSKEIRQIGPAGGVNVRGILGQNRGRRSTMELSDLTDSLVTIVNSGQGVSLERRRIIVSEIAASGSERMAVPFAGAGAALLRIIEGGDPEITAGAVSAVRSLANKPEAVRILVQVAESKNTAAWVAVMMLFNAKEISVEGKQALRQMWTRGSVTEKDALDAITTYAKKEGWPPRP